MPNQSNRTTISEVKGIAADEPSPHRIKFIMKKMPNWRPLTKNDVSSTLAKITNIIAIFRTHRHFQRFGKGATTIDSENSRCQL